MLMWLALKYCYHNIILLRPASAQHDCYTSALVAFFILYLFILNKKKNIDLIALKQMIYTYTNTHTQIICNFKVLKSKISGCFDWFSFIFQTTHFLFIICACLVPWCLETWLLKLPVNKQTNKQSSKQRNAIPQPIILPLYARACVYLCVCVQTEAQVRRFLS